MWLLEGTLADRPHIHYAVWCGYKGVLFMGGQWMSVVTSADEASRETARSFFLRAGLKDLRSVSLFKVKKVKV